MKTQKQNSGQQRMIPFRGKHSVALACLALGAGVLVVSGCAQYTAMNQPKPFKPTATVVGADRATVACELGAPLYRAERTNKLTETYKYFSGSSWNHPAGKTTRVVIYTAGDVFTLFLDQLLTWPFEAYTFAGTEHIVTVQYVRGENGSWQVQDMHDVNQGKSPEPFGEPATQPISMTNYEFGHTNSGNDNP
jgi:hypothetical protein